MVDCIDRIHLKLAEVVLRPLKELQERSELTSVTIRPPGRGPRVFITVSKTWPSGPDRPPVFAWSAREMTPRNGACTDAPAWTGDVPRATPEEAYWSAMDVISASRRPA